MMPPPERMAIHQAGHAVIQALVGGQYSAVARVSLHGPHGSTWRGLPAHGESLLHREIVLGLYEFGLMTLAGIAAEERYLADMPPESEPVVALSDLAEWQDAARQVLGDQARVDLVSRNVMRKLGEWMADEVVWRVVERLAGVLLAQGAVEGEELQRILAPMGMPR
jgi:hypothetical protein